ncbi:ATP-dependent helicase HrpB [Citricoccus nitrophenolicus]|uniref:ATP-dependent helicase HrpB n=1 Tax=Citricoccus nitrophenolicus TaxID=863575 RepID=A0ABV0IK23_9MICC
MIPSVSSGASSGARSDPFDLDRLGAGLVFAASLPELQNVLSSGRLAVVQAPPGTGKTTLVPPAAANLLAAGAGTGGRVVVTQPRRVAARAAARRLAGLDGSAVGGRSGYVVRGERQTGPGTLVEFVTPGVLVGRLLADPELAGTGAVILDEVHERDLETDLLFGMLGEVAQLRPELLLVAMSATLDAERFAARLGAGAGRPGPAPVVDCPSALHPVDVRYRPASGLRQDLRGVSREFLDHVAHSAAQAHAEALATAPDTDALVFVPGAREVTEVASRLRALAPGTEVLSLHGQLPPAEQDRAIGGRDPADPTAPPRIIVSTSLAESSLTVPGVRLVVDSGLAREPRRDAARGMTGLVTVACAQASAEQRAGRAGRLGPGTVVRCYDRTTYGTAPAHPTPALRVADLTGAALVLACWGAPGGEGLVLPEPLPEAPLAEALETLRALDAIDGTGRATDHGRRLVAIPAEPRLARALLDGGRLVGARAAAEVVALVASDVRPVGADLTASLARLRAGGDGAGGGRGAEGDAGRWRREAQRLERLAAAPGQSRDRGQGHRTVPREAEVGAVVGLAWPERLSRHVGGGVYLLASGTRAALPPGSPLDGAGWLAVAEVSRAEGKAAAGTGAVIRAAAAVDADLAVRLAGPLYREETTAHWQADGHTGRVVGRSRRTLGAIVLTETPVAPDRATGRAAVVRLLAEHGPEAIGLDPEASPGAEALRRRLDLLHGRLGEPWPDVSSAALAERWEEWLAPEVERLAGGTRAGSLDLAAALRRLLPWPEAGRLDELVPERLPVPSGRTARIEYPAVGAGGEAGDRDGAPVVAVKLQECFGLAETPRLVGGRVPVVFHLLSPAGRPLAVTGDLASFWSGPYAQVRAEMRGRYPKHPWPEDPWTAQATARTKERM